MTFVEELDYLVKAEALLKGTSIKIAESRIAKRLGVASSTVQRWRYLKHKDSFKPRLSTPRGVPIEKSVRRSYLNRQKQKATREISRKPPTLHVVCSPGGGAFSVYMFIRYALAQNEHFNAQVKMTMLCRKEEDGSIAPEKWWERWQDDEEFRQWFSVPDGWAPQFLCDAESDGQLLEQTRFTKEIFILAGGEQKRLVEAYRHMKAKRETHQQVVLLTEEDLVIYLDQEFAFQPAFDTKSVHLPSKHNLSPQESLVAVEIAQEAKLDELLNARTVFVSSGKRGKAEFDVFWNKEILFLEQEPTRLVVKVQPIFPEEKKQKQGKNLNKKKLKEYARAHIEPWFDWRKSLRFKLAPESEKMLDQFFARRPDARKLFMYEADKKSSRGENSRDSILFSSPKEGTSDSFTARTLILIAWDSRNIGRSTQLLSQSLDGLEKEQNLLLVDFSEGHDVKKMPLSSQIIKSIECGIRNEYTQGFEKFKINANTMHSFLESEHFSSFQLSTIGLNGPSLKKIIDSIGLNKSLQLFGENDLDNQFKNLKPVSLHRGYIRGIFPTTPLGEQYSQMEFFEKPWLWEAKKICYITWLGEEATEFEAQPKKNRYFPPHFMCTMDKEGKILHVFDAKISEALEVLLYIALFHLQNAEEGSLFTASPNPKDFMTKKMFGRTNFDNSDLTKVSFPGQDSTQNAEIWFTRFNKGKLRHFVGDAKAKYDLRGSNALTEAESAFSSLASKYNWNTLYQHIRVLMLTLFGGEEGSLANDNPCIFSKQSYFGLKEKPKRALEELYSIEVSRFAEYIKSFMREYQPDITPISFQEYRSNDAEGHSNFEAKLPFHQSESIPKKNQTSLHFFRKKPPSDADKKNIHSGFFFDPNTYDFQEAFYFHNKSLFAVGEYFLTSQGKDDHDSRERLNHVSDLQELIDFIDAILSPTKKSKNVFFDPFAPRETTKTSGGQFELSEDDTKLLTRLEQITNEMQIKSPEQQNRDYLSKWAEDVLYHLYQKADESMTYDSENPPNLPLNNKINEIFMAAAESAKNQHPQSMNKFNDFIRGLRSFSNSFSVQAPKRYDWYLRQKSRRSSQSSQSDA